MTVAPASHVNVTMEGHRDGDKSLIQKLMAMSSSEISCSELEQAISHFEVLKKKKFESEYLDLSNNVIEAAGERLREATISTCEPKESPLHPRKCLKEVEEMKGVDLDFMKALLNSAQIKECEFPPFNDYTESDEGSPSEFKFIIVFSFGFKMSQMKDAVFCGLKPWDVPSGVCGIISNFVGDSFFEIKLTVYFDKAKPEWNEQDGEAWIFHRDEKTGKLEDVVNFDGEQRIYYVDDWPLKGLVVDSLNSTQVEKLEFYERRLITWTCCQIVWFALNKHISKEICHSAMVRKMTKKIIAVLKGWFTGLLLGESFEPPSLYFDEE